MTQYKSKYGKNNEFVGNPDEHTSYDIATCPYCRGELHFKKKPNIVIGEEIFCMVCEERYIIKSVVKQDGKYKITTRKK